MPNQRYECAFGIPRVSVLRYLQSNNKGGARRPRKTLDDDRVCKVLGANFLPSIVVPNQRYECAFGIPRVSVLRYLQSNNKGGARRPRKTLDDDRVCKVLGANFLPSIVVPNQRYECAFGIPRVSVLRYLQSNNKGGARRPRKTLDDDRVCKVLGANFLPSIIVPNQRYECAFGIPRVSVPRYLQSNNKGGARRPRKTMDDEKLVTKTLHTPV